MDMARIIRNMRKTYHAIMRCWHETDDMPPEKGRKLYLVPISDCEQRNRQLSSALQANAKSKPSRREPH